MIKIKFDNIATLNDSFISEKTILIIVHMLLFLMDI